MNILERIVEDTRAIVAGRKRLTPLARLASTPSYAAPTLALSAALRAEGLSVIAEIKKASPSAGVLCTEFQVDRIARKYSHAGASAVSVLTEPLHFLGGLDHLAHARGATDLPILRKDFIVDSYQLHEARAYGADAVLLIAAVLEKSELFDLHQEAEALGLSCLVEIHDVSELEKVDFDQVRILGVNNRDLRTFAVDLDHAVRVFQIVPDTVIRVSESGVRDPADLAYLEQNGIHAVLIGESFMRAPDPGQRLREFIARSKALVESHGLRLVG